MTAQRTRRPNNCVRTLLLGRNPSNPDQWDNSIPCAASGKVGKKSPAILTSRIAGSAAESAVPQKKTFCSSIKKSLSYPNKREASKSDPSKIFARMSSPFVRQCCLSRGQLPGPGYPFALPPRNASIQLHIYSYIYEAKGWSWGGLPCIYIYIYVGFRV